MSIRNQIRGTYYGRFLAENIARFAKDRDFEYILKKTAQKMSKERNVLLRRQSDNAIVEQKLMSSWRAVGWKKLLYFNPGIVE